AKSRSRCRNAASAIRRRRTAPRSARRRRRRPLRPGPRSEADRSHCRRLAARPGAAGGGAGCCTGPGGRCAQFPGRAAEGNPGAQPARRFARVRAHQRQPERRREAPLRHCPGRLPPGRDPSADRRPGAGRTVSERGDVEHRSRPPDGAGSQLAGDRGSGPLCPAAGKRRGAARILCAPRGARQDADAGCCAPRPGTGTHRRHDRRGQGIRQLGKGRRGGAAHGAGREDPAGRHQPGARIGDAGVRGKIRHAGGRVRLRDGAQPQLQRPGSGGHRRTQAHGRR
ncbi:MAG: hypothetical protein H6R11_1539, partial [Proteobacteria bacterium]|nr:hypothetical protein [Pseudomonadota bacterium]